MKFECLEPKTVEEAISSLQRHGSDIKILAGGTDLVVKMKQHEVSPSYLLNMAALQSLDYIRFDKQAGVHIGALTTLRSIEKCSELISRGYGILSQAARQIAFVQVRNVGTIGGNLCNASPAADMVPALIGLSATAKIVGPNGERKVPVEDFFIGPGLTVLRQSEILAEIQVPSLPSDSITEGVYLKHSPRGPVDLAIVGVAVVLSLEPKSLCCTDARVALGAVASTPIRTRRTEAILTGKILNHELIALAANTASNDARPISDVRASKEYRTKMVSVFTKKALELVLEQAKNRRESSP